MSFSHFARSSTYYQLDTSNQSLYSPIILYYKFNSNSNFAAR